jgi:two-component system nitrogen regulation sensor histidine kinase GlnL
MRRNLNKKQLNVATQHSKQEPQRPHGQINAATAQILNAIAQPIICVDDGSFVEHVNYAAEQFFLKSEKILLGQPLKKLLGPKSPILALVDDARRYSASYSDYDVSLTLRAGQETRVDVQINAVMDAPGSVVIIFDPRTMASQISRQLATQNAARAASSVATMLAHEIKNPLSGIRGAAQLIEESLPPDEIALAQLIVKETDRIVTLVDQMEVFSDDRPLARQPQNIHHVLDHVLAVARNGFAAELQVDAAFDPSLPSIDGNWNQLVQAFLNLLKNASEAAPKTNGFVKVRTAFSHGTRMRLPGEDKPVDLPIEISISDNGPGVSDEIRETIFDPFVSSKTNGKGLGLALVSKLVNAHGGFVGYAREGGQTVFRVLLPAAKQRENV